MTEAQRALAAMFDGGPKFLGLPDAHARPPVYAEPLSDTAIAIGEEKLIGDLVELGDFLAGCEDVREPAGPWFAGPVSTHALVRIILCKRQEPMAILPALAELRRRFVEEKSEYVRQEALKAEQA